MTMSKRPEAMIDAAASHHGSFFEAPQSRRGFAGVENARLCGRHRIDKAPGKSGNPGKALEKIQRTRSAVKIERAAPLIERTVSLGSIAEPNA
jgi:hypothetical protein